MGLWARLRPHPRDPDVTVLMLDTEGLDAPHVDQSYNWALSTVVVLISSLFLYQTTGSIDKAATDRLDLILTLAARVSEPLQNQSSHTQSTAEDASCRPRFLWLLRDHHLLMRRSPKDEMLEKLDDSARAQLQRCFSSVDCIPLPCPVDNEQELLMMDRLQFPQLSQRFQEEFLILERNIFNSTMVQQFGGQTLTGPVLADMLGIYSKLIFEENGGLIEDIEAIPTQAQILAQIAAQRATDEALASYSSLMQSAATNRVDAHKLHSGHVSSQATALKVFDSIAYAHSKSTSECRKALCEQLSSWSQVCSKGVTAEHCDTLSRLVGGAYHEIWQSSFESSRIHCQREWDTISAALQVKVQNSQFDNLEQFVQESGESLTKWRKSPNTTGLFREEQQQSAEKAVANWQQMVLDSVGKKRIAACEQRVQEEMQQKMSTLSKSMQDQLALHQSQLTEHDKTIVMLNEHVRELQRSAELLQGSLNRQAEEAAENKAALELRLELNIQKASDELATASAELGALVHENMPSMVVNLTVRRSPIR